MSDNDSFNPFVRNLIKKVDALRDERGYSVERMCELAGISTSTWGKIKGGLTQDPKILTLLGLAHCFDVSVSYLTGESEYKTIDNSIVLKELAKLGFSEEMVENLRVIKDTPNSAWSKYEFGLKRLLTNHFDEENLPLLFSIGKYLSILNATGKDLVETEDLQKLNYAINNPDLSTDVLKLQMQKLLDKRTEYNADALKGYWLQQTTYELQRIKKVIDIATEAVTESFSEKKTKKGAKAFLEKEFSEIGNEEKDVTLYTENELN